MRNTNRRKRINSLHFKTIKNWWISEHKNGHSINLFFISSAQSIEIGKVDMEILKNVHKKHGIKLTESKMEPVLLVQTMVPGGVGKSQNKGKGLGGTNVETWKGKRQLEFTQLVMFKSSVRPPSLNCLQNAYRYHIFKKYYTLAIQPPSLNDCLTLPLGNSEIRVTRPTSQQSWKHTQHILFLDILIRKKKALGWHLRDSFSFT